MRRVDRNMLKRLGLDPSIRRAAAGKDQRMDTVPVDHRQLEIFAERRR